VAEMWLETQRDVDCGITRAPTLGASGSFPVHFTIGILVLHTDSAVASAASVPRGAHRRRACPARCQQVLTYEASMACKISGVTITGTTVDPAGKVVSLTVEGDVTECRYVEVSSSCSSTISNLQIGSQVPDPAHFVTYLGNDTCPCASLLDVVIKCFKVDRSGKPATSPCATTTFVMRLTCPTIPPEYFVAFECPRVTIGVRPGTCLSNGRLESSSVTVGFDPPLPPGTSYDLQLDFGDTAGQHLQGATGSSDVSSVVVLHPYTKSSSVRPTISGTITNANGLVCSVNFQGPSVTLPKCTSLARKLAIGGPVAAALIYAVFKLITACLHSGQLC
jgi:hypothetical protein